MNIPTATYRVQLSEAFTLGQLEPQIAYLRQLGISTVYASPVFQARAGSTHGYDVTNPQHISSDIGTEEELARIAQQLEKLGMSWLQDIVPNHMAYDPANPWINDLLEKGQQSPYAHYFDVNWQYDDDRYRGKIMAPFLGSPLPEVVANQQLSLSFDKNGLQLNYYDHRLPLSVNSYPGLLRELAQSDSVGDDEAKVLSPWIKRMEAYAADQSPDPDTATVWSNLTEGLFLAVEQNASVRAAMQQLLDAYPTDTGRLMQLLERQNYRLVHWKTTEKEINYRRFFTVNDLICINIHRPEVFEHYHRQLARWVAEGYVQGVRVDHIDGLLDPTAYVHQLRQLVGDEAYVVVEKILEHNEKLPTGWPVQGESGYGFLADVNQLFTDPEGSRSLLSYYTTWNPPSTDYEDLVYRNKGLVLHQRMRGELNNLMSLASELDLVPSGSSKEEQNQPREALGHLLVAFPVYRIYSTTFPFSPEDQVVLDRAFARATERAPELSASFDTWRTIFRSEASGNEDYDQRRLRLVMRFQQFAGPLAAKGVEDTTFYQYFPLIAHNEVGDSPERLGVSTDDFHHRMEERPPHALNATATHDTKRGEDARRRISVLSELPSEWMKETTRWRYANEPYKSGVDEHEDWPTANFEYFIYQTLLGTYPFYASPEEENYAARLQDFLLKAAREAKVNTSWSEPNEAYEKAINHFVTQLLQDRDFIDEFVTFAEPIAQIATTYSLGQTLLKVTAPGVPDVYQGSEYWDLSMVDPDNRRPVNYRQRQDALQTLDTSADTDLPGLLRRLNDTLLDPSGKLFVLSRSLRTRQARPELFAHGAYEPLEVRGPRQKNLLAFRRTWHDQAAIVLMPVGIASQTLTNHLPLGEACWADTEVVVPEAKSPKWTNVFTQQKLTAGSSLAVSEVLRDFPVALLTNTDNGTM